MEHTRAFLAYDTLCRIAAEIPEDGEQLLEQCEEEAHGLERTLSMFDPDSELSRLCRDIRPGEAVPVSETLYTFLEQNLEICRLSSGAFDPTVGPVVKLWDFLSQTPRIPSAERIRAVLDRVGYQHVRLDRNTRTVTFDLSGIGLDPGAAGKGFALGLTVDRLRQGGVRQAVLDYGGNMFVIGAHQDAHIRYPYSARKYAQKSPAGPHPTTTGRDFNFSLPPAGKTYGIASWSCTLPARFFRVSIFKSCFSLSAFTSTV